MLKLAARIAVLALAVVALAPADASAQFREFVGKIESIDSSRMTVDSRGDKMVFRSSGETVVQGKTWPMLKKDDRVSVSWKMTDKPPIAHRVVVMPPRD